ncbi:MAG: substrate-binding domain-containing protein [Caldilineae bacterium]|nr:substrate-binding domain-containing protein [Anaerolineae bacterium]MCB0204149.1 substrate-binding domain-containing protein [Anaerolineae bacterium]MCB0254538.1 substrate-binding domain-containing protein [Anaerolineae bacterium]MCB9153178.1 substrate-binding domain-containing protein [Caldilineae bacterium]
MNRTRVIFIVIVVAALAIVGMAALVRLLSDQPSSPLVVEQRGPVNVRVLTALPVYDWINEAAKQFNAEGHELDGNPIQVEIISMDGLSALGKFDRDEFGALPPDVDLENLTPEQEQAMERFPTAWIPDSRYLPELANVAYKERLGRDVFLTDGEYRARPIAISLFAWGVYQSRAEVLQQMFGDVDWQVIHDAATARGGWPELGGLPEWGFFKLVVPNPRKNVGGLAAMVAAAGEYYDRAGIGTAEVTDPDFQQWLGELMGSTTDLSGGSAYTAEDFALFGYSAGDGGQLLESDLLNNMEGIQTRWGEPLEIFYPKYVTWFDFPFTTWIGPETSAAEKNAALEFQRYLLSPEVQAQAVAYGLRPVNAEVSVDQPDSPFTRWADQGVVPIVSRTEAMRSPDRDVLLALLRWFDLNVAQ